MEIRKPNLFIETPNGKRFVGWAKSKADAKGQSCLGNTCKHFCAILALALLSHTAFAAYLYVNGSGVRLDYGQSASLSSYGVNGNVTLGNRGFVVSLQGGTGLKKLFTNDANLEIKLTGDNYISCDSDAAVECLYNVTISGPGSLVITQSAGYFAIRCGGLYGNGKLTINLGAVVGVNMWDETYSAVCFEQGLEVSNAALHVNSFKTGLLCRGEGGISVNNSVLTVISRKSAIQYHETGRISISRSSVHLSSSGGAAALDLSDGIYSSPEVTISDSLVTVFGAGNGIKSESSVSFNNVVGVVAGRNAGIVAPSLAVSGAASDLVVVGNVAGENAAALPSADSPGCGMFLIGNSTYSQSAGKVHLFSPGNYAMVCSTCAVTGGQLEIGGGITWADMRKTYTLEAAAAALEAGIGCATQGANWGLTDVFLANIFTGAWNPGWTLFNASSSTPLVGIDSDTARFLGGRHSVNASSVGICVGIELNVANATLSVEGGIVGICDAYALKTGRYSITYNNEWNSSVVIGSGGTLSAKGGKVGAMLCGVVWQRGGTFVAAATNGGDAREISSWPYLSGYAVSANGDFRRDAGTFSATKGRIRIKKQTSSIEQNFTVRFNANGGKLPKGKKMAAQTMTFGKATKLRKNVFTKKGRVFAGWAVSKANAKKGLVAYTNAQSVKNLCAAGKTTTLYAVWAKQKYKIAFYANGGKGKMAAQTVKYGKATKLRANKFKKKGFAFLGWSKKKNGPLVYKNKQAIKNLSKKGGTIKLYAKWGIIITFNANGGSVTPKTLTTTYGKKLGSLPTPVRKDWRFGGWYTRKAGGRRITATMTATRNLTLYAHWSPVSTMDPNANDGTAPLELKAPTGLSATNERYILLSWNAVGNIRRYEIWRGTSTDAASLSLVAVSTTTYYYDDSGTTAGVTYYYRVRAISGTVAGAFSDFVTAIRYPFPPENVSTEGLLSGVRVVWSASSDAMSYRVFREEAVTGGNSCSVGTTTETSFVDTSAEPGLTYRYWVGAEVWDPKDPRRGWLSCSGASLGRRLTSE